MLSPGSETVAFDCTSEVRVGMACCFDLRFPSWLSHYGPRPSAGAKAADALCIPSAFLDVTVSCAVGSSLALMRAVPRQRPALSESLTSEAALGGSRSL